MKLRQLVKNLCSLVIACSFASMPLQAQAAPQPPRDAQAALEQEEPGERTESLEADVMIEDAEIGLADEISGLDLPEMKERGTNAVEEMRAQLRTANKMLSEARRARDLVLISCVNERIKQIRSVLAIAEADHNRLAEQTDAGNLDGARVSFTKLMISKERVGRLHSQCQSCVGVESFYYGDTQVQTEVNPELAGGDPFFGDRQVISDPRLEIVRDFRNHGTDDVPLDVLPPSSMFR